MNTTGERMKISTESLFDKCVRTVLRKDGTIQIRCKLGLWCCSGQDREQVKREARHYFALYHSDGDYDQMLSNAKSRGWL